MLDLTPDQVLTTTRTVRRRLDFSKRVERSLIEECLEIAFQAPNGSNMNNWHWVVIDDPTLVQQAGRIYNEGLDAFIETLGGAVGDDYMGASVPRYERISESTQYLRDHIHESPALLLPLLVGRTEGANAFYQASHWGSIVQAVWSFMLALRPRGLGSAWTTGHLWREEQMAALLGVPFDQYTQVGLFPIAYTVGTDFRAAYRKPLEEVVSWNCFEG